MYWDIIRFGDVSSCLFFSMYRDMVKYFVLSMSIYLYVYVYLSLFLFFVYRKLIFPVINTAEMGSLSGLLYIHLFTWKQCTTNRPIKRPCNIPVSLHATEYATRHCSGLVCTYTEPANQSFKVLGQLVEKATIYMYMLSICFSTLSAALLFYLYEILTAGFVFVICS